MCSYPSLIDLGFFFFHSISTFNIEFIKIVCLNFFILFS
jgi:hypothetical protein